jgi:hypothetical protein
LFLTEEKRSFSSPGAVFGLGRPCGMEETAIAQKKDL